MGTSVPSRFLSPCCIEEIKPSPGSGVVSYRERYLKKQSNAFVATINLLHVEAHVWCIKFHTHCPYRVAGTPLPAALAADTPVKHEYISLAVPNSIREFMTLHLPDVALGRIFLTLSLYWILKMIRLYINCTMPIALASTWWSSLRGPWGHNCCHSRSGLAWQKWTTRGLFFRYKRYQFPVT